MLVIRDMEMPNSCKECPICNWGTCGANRDMRVDTNNNARNTNCPLEEIKKNTNGSRLTFTEPDGTWGVRDMNNMNEEQKMYAVASKLRDYEKTGISPDEADRLSAMM